MWLGQQFSRRYVCRYSIVWNKQLVETCPFTEIEPGGVAHTAGERARANILTSTFAIVEVDVQATWDELVLGVFHVCVVFWLAMATSLIVDTEFLPNRPGFRHLFDYSCLDSTFLSWPCSNLTGMGSSCFNQYTTFNHMISLRNFSFYGLLTPCLLKHPQRKYTMVSITGTLVLIIGAQFSLLIVTSFPCTIAVPRIL